MFKYTYFIFLGFILLTPFSSQAFTPFNQSAKVIEENAGIFMISYGFTAKSEVIYLPILGSLNPKKNEFGFRVRANDEPGAYDQAFGFVLTDKAEVENGMYVIKPGQSAVFTAVMVVQASSTDDTAAYHTHLNYLPFYQGASKRYIPLNKYQLKTYVTPKINL